MQTTRHRIKGFLTKENEYQIIFSDTPGIIEPKYKLHERMMRQVKSALEDADIALLTIDINDDLEACDALFQSLKLKVPTILILNKIDEAATGKIALAESFFADKPYAKTIVKISALQQHHLQKLLKLDEVKYHVNRLAPFAGLNTFSAFIL